ncbi:Uncharacterised protein [Mycobacteroides abscessus subsp. abscessus]|nr:Uncharacterised protein [Mycobacteroides abscessus subsp. abscessus]
MRTVFTLAESRSERLSWRHSSLLSTDWKLTVGASVATLVTQTFSDALLDEKKRILSGEPWKMVTLPLSSPT